jgi:hypothetical protein
MTPSLLYFAKAFLRQLPEPGTDEYDVQQIDARKLS